VPERFFRFFRELDSRVKVTIAGIGIHNWGLQLTMQYNQLYATDLGADAVSIGLLNSIAAAVSSIVAVPLGWAAEKYTARKVMLLGLACAALSAAIFALAGNWLMLIPAFILGSRLVRILALADIIFITATKPQQRATVVALSRVVWGILNIFAPMTAALIVASFGGINAQGIRPLYYIQLVLTVFVSLFIAGKLQPLPSHLDRKEDKLGSKGASVFQGFRELFQGEKWLKRWVAIRIIRQFGINLTMPFIPLWMVNVKGATPYILGTMGAASVIMSLALQIPAGRLADRIGRKRVYFLLRPISYLGTLLLILAPSPEYLIVVGLLGAVTLGEGIAGGIGGVSFTPFITMFWEIVPEEKRGRWFGIEGLMNISTIPASILGGILWRQGLMTEVLLLPILLEALVVIPILTTVPDTLVRSNQ
jgi:MFS family permease